jgi:hypothetical protein
MNNALKSNTNIKSKLTKEEMKINNLVNFGNSTTMNSNTFDIKNYLNLYEKLKPQKSKNKKSYKILNSVSKLSTFDTKFKPANLPSEGIVTSTNYKTSSLDKNFGKGLNMKKNFNIMTSTYIGNNNSKIKDLSFYKFPYTKSSNNFIYNRNKFEQKYAPTQTNESFNVFKVVKEIKKSLQFPKIVNNSHSKNKKAQIRNVYPKNIENLPIAYKDKYISSVFDSTNVLNNYNSRKELQLDIDNDLKGFPIKTKRVAIKNVLIDLLNNETVKLTEKEKILKAKNEKNEKILLTELKEFNEFTEQQKQQCKNLEIYHENLQRQNELLIKELVNFRVNKKINTDETQKTLEQIESLRNYALFVHKALEKDSTRYEKSIFPNYQEEKIDEYEKNIEKVKNEVLKNYQIFWDKQYKDQLKNELKFLNNIDSMSFKFKEIEGNIMRLLEELSNIEEEVEAEKKRDDETLKYLRERFANTTEEYEAINEKFKIEQNYMNNLAQKENELNSEYIVLIKELFLSILEVFGRFDKKKLNYNVILKEKIDKDNVELYLKEGERILRSMEDYLNSTLLEIKSFKDNDGKFFNQFMVGMKKRMKEEQIIQFKKNKMNRILGINNEIINKANKVPFILRQTAVPYHSPKKKEKKVINYDLIKKIEDEELIKYQ